MSKRRSIQNALPIVAASYGERFGVKVAISGDTASTDGKTITVPNIPDDYPHMDAVWGYLTHEAAHVRFTNFEVNRKPGLHAALTNVLEDCRIEKAMIQLYPGCEKTLMEVANHMAITGMYQHVTAEEHPGNIVMGYCLYWVQNYLVGQTVLQSYVDTAKVALEATFPLGMVVKLNALLRKAGDCSSTAEAARLAEQIINMMEEEKDKPDSPDNAPQQGDQSQGKGESQSSSAEPQSGDQSSPSGDDDDSSTGGGGASSSDGGQKDDSENGESGKAGSGGDGKGTASSKSAQSGASSSGGESQDGDRGKQQAIAQALSANGSELRKDAHEALKAELMSEASQSGDASYRTVRDAVRVPGHEGRGKQLLDDVKSTTAKIRAQLLGLVQASQRNDVRIKRSGKRVDSKRLSRVVTGDTRLFQSSKERIRPNTAVHVLVDVSSSMARTAKTDPAAAAQDAKRSSRAELASEAALAIALALEAIPGVNPGITFFGADEQTPVFSAVKHGESVKRNVNRFIMRPTGQTPMAEAIWYSAFELSKVREERKVLIIVTDGIPNSPDATQAVINLALSSGFDVMAIGIESDAIAKYVSKSITINDVSDLKKTLFKLVERSLTAQAA